MPLLFGADYHPEQGPEKRWKKDAALMSEAGSNTVRLTEFAWGKIEPKEGDCHFEWLDMRSICFPEGHKGNIWHSYGCFSTFDRQGLSGHSPYRWLWRKIG